jgi:hypothetical protein
VKVPLGACVTAYVCIAASASVQQTGGASGVLAEGLRLGEGIEPTVAFERINDVAFGDGVVWVLEPRQVRAFDTDWRSLPG